MVGGGVAGFVVLHPTWYVRRFIRWGATVGAGGGAGLQQLGNTAKAAYMAYVNKASLSKRRTNLPMPMKVDGAKTGALASVATLVAPLRFGGVGVGSGVLALQQHPHNQTALGQFAQQSLIVQPTLKLLTPASNEIAANSYDPTRTLNQGALDAFVGSIFFDSPTTAGGYLLKYRGKYRPAFDTAPCFLLRRLTA